VWCYEGKLVVDFCSCPRIAFQQLSTEDGMDVSIQSFRWIHGSPDCAASTDPPLQSFQFDPNTFIIRQSKCQNFEAPFMYLLIGTKRALLLDSGARPQPSHPCPIQETVSDILHQWQNANDRHELEIVVAHSHAHGDHTAGDYQFRGRPNTTIVSPALDEVKMFFGLSQWPDGSSTLDLGGRSLVIFPIPGHEPSHIAVYDSLSHVLLTGDTLYPGLLTVQDWEAYRASATRLAQFAKHHPISLVLGAHIEMKSEPGQRYEIGTTFQPDEHSLPLTAKHIEEWHNACKAMGAHPHYDVHNDFIIEPLESGEIA
jgi:hydroxyacylglutathione hydrolase